MITGIAHTAITVHDLDESLDFYCGKLGLEEAFRLDRDGKVWLVYLHIKGTQFLELFPGGERKEVDRRPGPPHLCLDVDDIRQTLADLKSRGLAIEGEARQGLDGNYQYWVYDPDGTKIELMQLMPGCMQLKAVEALEAAARG